MQIIEIDDAEAFKLGFAPECACIPLSPEPGAIFAVIGLVADRSKVTFSPDAYKLSGRKIVSAGSKTYNKAGMVGALDLQHQSNHRLLDATGGHPAVAAALVELRRRIADVFGSDVVTRNDLPPDFRTINAALTYLGKNKKDHARLMLRWPWLSTFFIERPDILARAVGGESLWDLMPEDFNPEMVKEMRKLRHFNSSWVTPGMQTLAFTQALTDACSYIPQGGQRPANAHEARALVGLVAFYEDTLRGLSAPLAERMKAEVIADGSNWRGEQTYRFSHTRDYVRTICETLLMDAFRCEGVTPTEDALISGALALLGTQPRRLIEVSEGWHRAIWQRRRERYGESEVASSWLPAIGTVTTPKGLFIVPLDTSEALYQEGDHQRHCISSYRRSCAEGTQRIASIREHPDGKPISTFRYSQEDGKIAIREHRAFANGKPSDEALDAAIWFESSANRADRPFALNLDWPKGPPPARPELRALVAQRFEDVKATLPKKLQKGGVEALFAACR